MGRWSTRRRERMRGDEGGRKWEGSVGVGDVSAGEVRWAF